MKIKFLGTAAAEGIPGMFCNCETCVKARKLGGKNLRSRSQALVDGQLLIDFPADTFCHSLVHNVDLTIVHYCLVTHNHADHWSADDLIYLKEPFSHLTEDWAGLKVYGSTDILPKLEQLSARGIRFVSGMAVEPFAPFNVGPYTVTALKAYHGTEHPYVYAISNGEKAILYGHDTDIFQDETWEYLKISGLHFDLVSLDCTEGAMEDLGYHGHGCLGRDRRFRERLKEVGVANEQTRFVLNHFSHNGLHACYDDFVPIAAADGFITSYDGLELEI